MINIIDPEKFSLYIYYIVEKLYPWGDQWEVGRTNLWQGKFPEENQLRDKYYGIAPVDAYKAQNDYEMYDVIGNVWEWTTTTYKIRYLYFNVRNNVELNLIRFYNI